MLHLRPESNGTSEPVSDATGQMAEATRRHHLKLRRASYAREHGVVREATEDRFHFTPSDTTAIKAAATQLLELLKTGKIARQHVESDQQADQHRVTGWAVAGVATDEQRRYLDNIKYRMAVRDQALDDFAGYELALLDSSTARSGRVVTSTPPRAPWTTHEANSASTYGYLMRGAHKKRS